MYKCKLHATFYLKQALMVLIAYLERLCEVLLKATGVNGALGGLGFQCLANDPGSIPAIQSLQLRGLAC